MQPEGNTAVVARIRKAHVAVSDSPVTMDSRFLRPWNTFVVFTLTLQCQSRIATVFGVPCVKAEPAKKPIFRYSIIAEYRFPTPHFSNHDVYIITRDLQRCFGDIHNWSLFVLFSFADVRWTL